MKIPKMQTLVYSIFNKPPQKLIKTVNIQTPQSF